GCVVAVKEKEEVAAPGLRRTAKGALTGNKSCAGDGRYVGEAPVLIVSGGVAQLGKTLPGILAQVFEKAGGRRSHARSTASSMPTYPVSSSSRASSLPPDLTMRPSASTCTKSGTM